MSRRTSINPGSIWCVASRIAVVASLARAGMADDSFEGRSCMMLDLACSAQGGAARVATRQSLPPRKRQTPVHFRTRHILPRRGRRRPAIHVFAASTRQDVDADPSLRLGQALRRHDDEGATVATWSTFFPQQI